MPMTVRARFWVEAGLAATTGLLTMITALWRDWVEIAFRVDPDSHSGSLEMAIVSALLLATLVMGTLARSEWRRPARLPG